MGRDTDPLYCLEQEDRTLAKGKEVIVYWTSDGFSFEGRARVDTLRPQCVTVELLEPVGHNGDYPAGHKVRVPRFADFTFWSSSNCVRTPPKDTFRHKDFL